MTPLIEARGVSKRFRQHKRFPGLLGAFKTLVTTEYTEVTAVNDISFDIAAGEAVGYLGPNGAGKSTMIKMMTGILVPSDGTLSVLGRTPHLERMANARQIGVVFGQRSQLWWDLPLIDSFTLHQRIYDIPLTRYQDNLKRFSELLDLKPFLDRAVRQLSLGQRMRAEIVMSLLHDPKILFLDEPTIGLDVVAKDAVRRFLAEINRERGVTIILTTHDLQDIETICPRLIMVDHAKLIFDGQLGKLRSALGSARRLTLEFATDPGPVVLSTATLTNDDGLIKHYLLEREEVSLVQILSEVGSTRDLKDVALHEPNIEEVIRTFYQRRNTASATTP
ncbi:ABC transporter ATP-binding protein [Devosia psychrophila]|uniref:ABC transporter ATP-binding protein n=1 Tax=Devosia psychrophila TaxID=728005 RepID=A0A0F5Q0G7_9HYPH|nr:ATP-binding cassette domain-containing protein [Devosia psychrophila]KKC34121.1 ABC transporter ATP-binding protein [Devosia psychrophila]SFC96590.1 ABC-2 type transport system ATP-binding protein [Devosia psychrophila]